MPLVAEHRGPQRISGGYHTARTSLCPSHLCLCASTGFFFFFFWKQGKMKHLFWGSCPPPFKCISASGPARGLSRQGCWRQPGEVPEKTVAAGGDYRGPRHGLPPALLEKIVLFLKFRSECCQCRCTDDCCCCCCCCKWYSDYSISFIILFPRSVSLKVSSHLKLIDAQFLVSKAILLVY